MANTTLKTRIKLLAKSYSEWQSIQNTFYPYKGEVCISIIPQTSGQNIAMVKIGEWDGVEGSESKKSYAQLPFLYANSADVFEWAKKPELEWSDMTDEFKQGILDLIGGEETNTLYQIVADGENKWKLQKSEDKGTTWVDATGVIDLSGTIANLEAEVAKKVEKELQGTNGKAYIFNEKDGGGAKFVHNDGSESFVGVNDGGEDGLMAQIYADKLVDGKWQGAKLDVTNDGIYYTVGNESFAQRAVEENELVTRKDIKDLIGVLHFRGVFNSLEEVPNPKHGDVVIVGAKEYVYVVEEGKAPRWVELGDEGIYETKADAQAAYAVLNAAIAQEEARAKEAEGELAQSIEQAVSIAQEYIDDKVKDEKERAEAAEAKKVDKLLEGTLATSEIFNEKDGGGSKLTGKDGVVAYVGTHDNIGGEIGTQIYVDKASGNESTIIDITQNGAYYNKGEIKPGTQRDVEAQEIAVKGDVQNAIDGLATIAKTGNVNDLVQGEEDVLILDCNL